VTAVLVSSERLTYAPLELAEARAEVARARARACQELRARLDAADDGSIPLASGLPRRVAALALFDGLHRALWLQAA